MAKKYLFDKLGDIKKHMLLSIVIPTKNRYEYLKHLVVALNSFESADFEVVIQDNSEDNSEFVDFIIPYLGGRFKYFYCQEHLDVVANSDRAILNSCGEYVCFIGDDDGVSSRITELAAFMKKNQIDACNCTMGGFQWPDVRYVVHKLIGLSVPKVKNGVREINLSIEIARCLKTGAFSLGDMPRVYHGMVSRVALNIVYHKTGSFFPGASPDMANAVALCFAAKKCFHIDTPFIISGHGYKSAGGMGARRQHNGDIEKIPHLPPNTKENWEPLVPLTWTGNTIYADAALKAFCAMGQSSLLTNFNYAYLYAAVLLFDHRAAQLVWPLMKGPGMKRKAFAAFVRLFILRSKTFVLNFTHSYLGLSHNDIYPKAVSIGEAIDITDRYIKNL